MWMTLTRQANFRSVIWPLWSPLKKEEQFKMQLYKISLNYPASMQFCWTPSKRNAVNHRMKAPSLFTQNIVILIDFFFVYAT